MNRLHEQNGNGTYHPSPPPSFLVDGLRGQLLALAARALRAVGADDTHDITVTLRCTGAVIQFTGRPPAPRPVQGLNSLQRAILAAATETPMTAKRLAAKVGRSCNSHFRDQLRVLVRGDLLRHLPDGYCLPAKPNA